MVLDTLSTRYTFYTHTAWRYGKNMEKRRERKSLHKLQEEFVLQLKKRVLLK